MARLPARRRATQVAPAHRCRAEHGRIEKRWFLLPTFKRISDAAQRDHLKSRLRPFAMGRHVAPVNPLAKQDFSIKRVFPDKR
jgi:hypothetical protein